MIFLLSLNSIYAQNNQDHRRHHRRGFWFGKPGYMKKQLGLSEKQINQIAKINKQNKVKMEVIRDKLFPKKKQLRKEILKAKVNLAIIKQILKQIAIIEVDLRYERIKHRLALEKILTAKQKKQLREERKKRRMRRRKRRMRKEE